MLFRASIKKNVKNRNVLSQRLKAAVADATEGAIPPLPQGAEKGKVTKPIPFDQVKRQEKHCLGVQFDQRKTVKRRSSFSLGLKY